MRRVAMAVWFAACAGLAARAADDKIDLTGTYTVVSGKKEGKDIDDKAKKAKYTATADSFTVTGGAVKYVFGYKLKTTATPVEIDMAVAEGPDGTKGLTAVGIVAVKGDTVKLAYSLDKEKRPKDFEGKAGYLIELKKEK